MRKLDTIKENDIYNNWKVIKQVDKDYFECECLLCNNIYKVYGYDLLNDTSKQCVKCGINIASNTKRSKYINKTINNVYIVDFSHMHNDRCVWDCICPICGKHFNATTYELTSGTVDSCHDCKMKSILEKQTIHGDTKNNHMTNLYRKWSRMRSRCKNPNVKDYKYYGGRGITVDETWNNDYSEFKKWALENGYDENNPNLSIERLDPNKNYTPDNCTFIDKHDQNKNKRNTIFVGDKCLADACREKGIKYCTVLNRLRAGWSMDDALNKPVLVRNRKYK